MQTLVSANYLQTTESDKDRADFLLLKRSRTGSVVATIDGNSIRLSLLFETLIGHIDLL